MDKEDYKKYLQTKYPHTSSFFTGFFLFIIDVIIIIFCIALGFFLVNLFARNNINFKSFINYCVFVPGIMTLFATFSLYPGIMIPPAEEVRKYFFGTFFGFTAIILSVILSNYNNFRFSKFFLRGNQNLQICIAFAIALFFCTFLLPACREIAKTIVCKYKWFGVPCVIYSTNGSANEVVDKLINNKYLGYNPAIIIDSGIKTESEYKGIPVIPKNKQNIEEVIHSIKIKNAIFCQYKGDINEIMNNYRYTISIPTSKTSFTSTQHIKDIAGIIGFASTHNLTFKTNHLIKRVCDISLIIIFLPLLIPVFLILSLLVKLTSKGPVFYGHKRIGKNGKEFKCWKFRSMNINSEQMLEQILKTDPVRAAEWKKEHKFQDDPRITKFGKFLRKTSLDELPQLLNILAGQMSFIGPRPVTKEETELYNIHKDYVLSVLPGLSGMWQISGRSDSSYDERIQYDIYYIQNWSIWLDIWILIKTVWIVISRKGAY
ncbi:MAG: undecaprenyl-phosphate galactose phosphotransferase WbaP [Treponema sp.]|nr:undecaprenyl-phosphate galactose phosphotransferase WbaP [Treponema sp.]